MIHNFRFILDGTALRDSIVQALLDGGCGDGLFGIEQGVHTIEFDRRAETFEAAVLVALEDVERAVPDVRIVRVEPDELVTASGIAERTGRTRQSVAQLIAGERGRERGEFPTPLTTTDGRTKIWHWT